MATANGEFENAYVIAREPNSFASICGRVCAARHRIRGVGWIVGPEAELKALTVYMLSLREVPSALLAGPGER